MEMAQEHFLISKERYERLLKDAAKNKTPPSMTDPLVTLKRERQAQEKDQKRDRQEKPHQAVKSSSNVEPLTKTPNKEQVISTASPVKARTRDSVLELTPNKKSVVATEYKESVAPNIPGIPKKDFERRFLKGRATEFKNRMKGLLKGLKKRELSVTEKNKNVRKRNKEIAKNWIKF